MRDPGRDNARFPSWTIGRISMSRETDLYIRLADGEEDLIATKRLRYRVFVEEFGAVGSGVDHVLKEETDRFDEFADHLVLVDRRRELAGDEHVVGSYRLIPGEVAEDTCGFYSSSEFDLSPLIESGKRLVELGRSCVHRDYRGGMGVYQLWRGLACYVLDNGIEVMFGVASFVGTDVQKLAPALTLLHRDHLAPPDMRVRVWPEHHVAMSRCDASEIDRKNAMDSIPPLIKGYLRLGGFVGDGAFIDRDFNTVDVCLIMDTTRMSERHRNYYVQVWGKR